MNFLCETFIAITAVGMRSQAVGGKGSHSVQQRLLIKERKKKKRKYNKQNVLIMFVGEILVCLVFYKILTNFFFFLMVLLQQRTNALPFVGWHFKLAYVQLSLFCDWTWN